LADIRICASTKGRVRGEKRSREEKKNAAERKKNESASKGRFGVLLPGRATEGKSEPGRGSRIHTRARGRGAREKKKKLEILKHTLSDVICKDDTLLERIETRPSEEAEKRSSREDRRNRY